MLSSALLLALVAQLAASSPIGSVTADAFPPTGTAPNPTLFPAPSVVGYAGPTVTGAEAFVFQTAPAGHFPKAQDSFGPLFLPVAADSGDKEEAFQPIAHWGNLSPRSSLPPTTWGASAESSPLIPQGCELVQVHQLFRHGSRYPSTGEAPSKFAQALNAASTNGTVTASGELAFLNDWTYKLGTEILNPFGRQQCYQLGVRSRMAYGQLLNNFTAAGKLPVFRTGSQDRMVETLQAFTQGFFGRDSEKQYSMLLEIEAPGINATESPVGVCPNYVKDFKGAAGISVANFTQAAFSDTAKRLQGSLEGYELSATDVSAMLSLCAYETISLGYSAFCPLFTEEDFKNFEYTTDLMFYYGFGFGSQTAAALGKGWVQELVARLTATPITVWDSSTNSTQDGNIETFPLDQAFYADATHDGYVATTLAALNLTNVFNSYGALPATHAPEERAWKTSQMFPFNTNFEVQVMTCPGKEAKQARFILNDAVIPLNKDYACAENKDGLCDLPVIVESIQKRLAEIDFDKACRTNWTSSGLLEDTNGMPTAAK